MKKEEIKKATGWRISWDRSVQTQTGRQSLKHLSQELKNWLLAREQQNDNMKLI